MSIFNQQDFPKVLSSLNNTSLLAIKLLFIAIKCKPPITSDVNVLDDLVFHVIIVGWGQGHNVF